MLLPCLLLGAEHGSSIFFCHGLTSADNEAARSCLLAAGLGTGMWGDSGMPQRGGSRADVRAVVGRALKGDLGVAAAGP